MSEIMHDMVCEMVTKTSKFMLIMSEKHVRMAKSIHILMMSHTNYPVIFYMRKFLLVTMANG